MAEAASSVFAKVDAHPFLLYLVFLVIFAVTFAFTCIPKTLGGKQRPNLFSGFSCASAGIFLATLLNHLLVEHIEHAMQRKSPEIAHDHNHADMLDYGLFVGGIVYMLLLIFDGYIGHSLLEHDHHHHEDDGHGHSHGHDHFHHHEKDEEDCCHHHEHDNHLHDEKHGADLHASAHAHDAEALASPQIQTVEKSNFEEFSPQIVQTSACQCPHDHEVSVSDLNTKCPSIHSMYQKKSPRIWSAIGFTIIIGLHSILEAFSMTTFKVCIAFSLHKFLEGLAVGSALLKAEIPAWLFYSLAVLFSALTPVTAAIYKLANPRIGGHVHEAPSMTMMVLNGLSIGSIFYVVFSEIVPHELSNRRVNFWFKMSAMFFGYMVCSALIKFDFSS